MSLDELPETLRLSADVRYRVIDDEALVLRQKAAEVIGLDEVGSRVLELIAGEATLGELVERMAEEYEVERAELERDLGSFLGELLERGVLEDAAGAAAGASPGAAIEEAP